MKHNWKPLGDSELGDANPFKQWTATDNIYEACEDEYNEGNFVTQSSTYRFRRWCFNRKYAKSRKHSLENPPITAY